MKNMKVRLVFAVCVVSVLSGEILAEADNEVKRGLFPFMGFLYYPDESVVDSTGTRFLRSAVLIRAEWLLSAAIDHPSVDGVPLGFPRKTLLARFGAISIDANFTLNEDEDEQEREVIQIVRPNLHNTESWWLSDISLLKTLLPFKSTFAVAPTSITPKREYVDKNCAVLVYSKRYGNVTEDRSLMQLTVELLPASIENCGNQFTDTTMTCGIDAEESKGIVYDPDYCQGNSGGPLMCEGEVMGLQTYIEGKCKQPHLYQLLVSWDTFITCGTTEKCNQEFNCNICTVSNKDNYIPREKETNYIPREKETTKLIELPTATSTKISTVDAVTEISGGTTEVVKEITTSSTSVAPMTTGEPKYDEDSAEKEDQTTSEIPDTTTLSSTSTTEVTTTETPSVTTEQMTTEAKTETTSTSPKTDDDNITTKWPENVLKVQLVDNNSTDKEESEKLLRMAKVEAQHQPAKNLRKSQRSSGSQTLSYLIINFIVTVALVVIAM